MGKAKTEGFSKDYNGEVLWFNDGLGYGFVSCPDFKDNLFVHYSRIMTDENFKTLSKGQLVTFSVAETNKKGKLVFMAVNVREQNVLKANVINNQQNATV